MVIDGKDFSKGNEIKVFNAMLEGAEDSVLREMGLIKWDEKFYKLNSDFFGWSYMVQKEFNCLVVWLTFAPTSFNGGDEFVQKTYKPLCILDKTRECEHQDVETDILNGLVRIGLLNKN